jgi:hypothetical protein
MKAMGLPAPEKDRWRKIAISLIEERLHLFQTSIRESRFPDTSRKFPVQFNVATPTNAAK